MRPLTKGSSPLTLVKINLFTKEGAISYKGGSVHSLHRSLNVLSPQNNSQPIMYTGNKSEYTPEGKCSNWLKFAFDTPRCHLGVLRWVT